MTDGDALRRAVVADPDDDTPRLIYADWLDEHGDPDRAAFIRAQVEAARAEPFGPSARAAADQADRLLTRHRASWADHLGDRVLGCEFVRGFVGQVTVDARTFPDHAGFIAAAEPVQAVRVVRPLAMGHFDESGEWVDGSASLRPVLVQPELWPISRLDLSGLSLSEDEYDALEESRSLVGVRDLSFRDAPVHPPRLARLLGGKALPNLCGLDLAGGSNLGPAVLAGLRAAGHRRFARLDLTDVVFKKAEDVNHLLGCACLREVEELRFARPTAVHRPDPGPLTGLDLGWALPWRRLRLLDLTGQYLGPGGVREVAGQPEAALLRWLSLADNDIGTGFNHLLDAKHLNLFHLDVRGNGLSRDAFAALRKRFPNALIPE